MSSFTPFPSRLGLVMTLRSASACQVDCWSRLRRGLVASFRPMLEQGVPVALSVGCDVLMVLFVVHERLLRCRENSQVIALPPLTCQSVNSSRQGQVYLIDVFRALLSCARVPAIPRALKFARITNLLPDQFWSTPASPKPPPQAPRQP